MEELTTEDLVMPQYLLTKGLSVESRRYPRETSEESYSLLSVGKQAFIWPK